MVITRGDVAASNVDVDVAVASMVAKNAVGQGAFRRDTAVLDVDVDVGFGVGVVGLFAGIIAINAIAPATATRHDGDVLRGDADFAIRIVSFCVIDYGMRCRWRGSSGLCESCYPS